VKDVNKKFDKILENFLKRFEINEIPENLIETYSDITDIDIDELKSRAVSEPKIMHSIVSFAKANHIDVYEKKIPKTSNKSAVIIEDRELPHLAALLKISINNLSKDWSHKLVCTKNSKQKIQEYCDKINPNIEVIAIDTESFTQETYNNTLLTKEFWENIKAEHILIYQQDAVVFKDNIDEFLEYDYIGAPWLAHQDDNTIGVGNGGFALRKKSTLLKCLETVHPSKLKVSESTENYMKSTGLSLPPEDVYFSKTIIDYKLGKVADRETAKRFSEERVKSPDSFGGHQYWLSDCYEMFKLYQPFQLEDWSYYYGEAETHRGGWKGLLNYMMQDEILRPDCGVSLVDVVEKYFVWDDLPVITKPWIAISHMTPNTPEHLAIVHIDLLLENEKFLKSLKYCKYLVVLTNYMKKYIEQRLGDKVKIVVLKHPTQLDIQEWSPDNFNPVAVVALGQQMRKLSTIYTLKTDLHKIWLYGHPDKKLMEERVDIELTKLFLNKSDLQEVELKKVENDEYDQLVTQQIVLLDIVDASANNAVVEMIGASIPFFVNRLESVEEYLGKDYPMFFDKIEEVEEKLKDISSLKKLYQETYQYMKAIDKTELSYDYFCSELLKLIN
jgi:hypothetical protein